MTTDEKMIAHLNKAVLDQQKQIQDLKDEIDKWDMKVNERFNKGRQERENWYKVQRFG